MVNSSEEKNKSSRLHTAGNIVTIVLAALAPFVFFFGLSIYENQQGSGVSTTQLPPVSLGTVKGESTQDTAVLESESFQVRQISFGGEGNIVVDQSEILPLDIYDVRSEVLEGKNSSEGSKVLITWKTNKLALSDLSYSKRNGSGAATVGESFYGFAHSIVLDNLDAGTGYVYTVMARDRFGNQVASDRYAVYTGTKLLSVFEMLSTATKDVFGWALQAK